MKVLGRLHHLLLPFIFASISHAQTNPSPQQIFERTKAATALILSGEGGGRLRGIGTGVIISRDGTLLTALHVVKGASELQVRLPDGDAFDRVELLGVDERRDIAALRITGSSLPALPAGEPNALAQGDSVYAVTNSDGLSWSATQGIVSAIRPSDEVSGAGEGFRLIQFTAPVAPSASGGALVNREGLLVGIITSKAGTAAFAVPIDSVLGLANSAHPILLGSGSALQLTRKLAEQVPQSSAAVANSDPRLILKDAKTIYIHSKTSFLTVDTLVRALLLEKQWPQLGVTIVQDQRVADLLLDIDRPLFTYVHTFVLSDKRTSIVLGSGKQTAFDGTIASGGLAKDIVKILAAAKLPQPPK